MEEDRTKSVWERRLADRQVRRALEELLDADTALVKLLLTRTNGLSAADIRSSLARAKLTVQFESDCRCIGTAEPKADQEVRRVAGMSDTELRIATWLQRRAIERWAKGSANGSGSRKSRRRSGEQRRSGADRRNGCRDRRVSFVKAVAERRSLRDRRREERRVDAERRLTTDRRGVRRRA